MNGVKCSMSVDESCNYPRLSIPLKGSLIKTIMANGLSTNYTKTFNSSW